MPALRRALIAAAAMFAIGPGMAHADGADGEPSSVLRSEILGGEAVGAFWVPNDFVAEDFAVVWIGDALPDVEATLEPNSLEWVRVRGGVLRVPRAGLVVRGRGLRGRVSNSGFSQPFADAPDGSSVARLEVPLVAGAGNPITVVRDDGKAGTLEIRFAPRDPAHRERILRDVSCSSAGLTVDSTGLRDDEWLYIGCETSVVASAKHATSIANLFVFWSGAGDTIEVGGTATPPVAESLWALQGPAKPGRIELASGDHRVSLRYFIPVRPHAAFVGVGVGPYVDTFSAPAPFRSFHTVEPLVTFYGAWTLSGASRIVGFNATPVRRDGYSDSGLYLQRRQAELFDRRAVFTVFLGAHLLAFKLGNTIYVRPGAPQGAELLFRDVGGRGRNVTIGGLINPGIAGKFYANGWLRWGSPKLFVELNYIGWREHTAGANEPIDLRSLGLSIGTPLIRAF